MFLRLGFLKSTSIKPQSSLTRKKEDGFSTILGASIASLLVGVVVANMSNTSIIREYVAGGNKDRVATRQFAAGGIEVLRAYEARQSSSFVESFLGASTTGLLNAGDVMTLASQGTYSQGDYNMTIRYRYVTDPKYFDPQNRLFPLAVTFDVTASEGSTRCSSTVSTRLCSAYTTSFTVLNSGGYKMKLASNGSSFNPDLIGKYFQFNSALTVLKDVSGGGLISITVKDDPKNYYNVIDTPFGYGLIKYGGRVDGMGPKLSYDGGSVDISSNVINKKIGRGTGASATNLRLSEYDADLFHDLKLNILRKQNSINLDDEFAKNLIGTTFADADANFSKATPYRYKWQAINRFTNDTGYGTQDVPGPAYSFVLGSDGFSWTFAAGSLRSPASDAQTLPDRVVTPIELTNQLGNNLALDVTAPSNQRYYMPGSAAQLDPPSTLNNEIHKSIRSPIYRLLGDRNLFNSLNQMVSMYSFNTNVINETSFGPAWNNQPSCGNYDPSEIAKYYGIDQLKYDLAWQNGSLMNCNTSTQKVGQTDNMILVLNNSNNSDTSVNGDITLAAGLVLVKGNLTIPAGQTLTIIGSLAVSGALKVDGTLKIKPRFYFGRLSGDSSVSSKMTLEPTKVDVCANNDDIQTYLQGALNLWSTPRSSYRICQCGYYRRTPSLPNYMSSPTCLFCNLSSKDAAFPTLNQNFTTCVENNRTNFTTCLTQVDTCKTYYTDAITTGACNLIQDNTLTDCKTYDQYCGKTCDSTTFPSLSDRNTCSNLNTPSGFCSRNRDEYCTRKRDAGKCNLKDQCVSDGYITNSGVITGKCNSALNQGYSSCADQPACIVNSCIGEGGYADSTSQICSDIVNNGSSAGGNECRNFGNLITQFKGHINDLRNPNNDKKYTTQEIQQLIVSSPLYRALKTCDIDTVCTTLQKTDGECVCVGNNGYDNFDQCPAKYCSRHEGEQRCTCVNDPNNALCKSNNPNNTPQPPIAGPPGGQATQ